MSGFPTDIKVGNVPQDDGLPRHRLHNPNELLPGSHADEQPAEVKQRSERDMSEDEVELHAQGYNAFNSERPLDVHPTRAGRCIQDIHFPNL
jgi:hypothetical protein